MAHANKKNKIQLIVAYANEPAPILASSQIKISFLSRF